MNRLYYPVFLASLALAGCGSDSDSSSPQDTEQPEVFNITPADQSNVSSAAITIEGNMTDNEAIRSVSVLYGGQTMAAAFDGDRFSADLTLTEGENRVEITATDTAGNAYTDIRTIVLDTQPPELTFVFPSSGHATQALTTTVRIDAADNQSVAAVSVVLGDQTVIAEAADGQYLARMVMVPGSNSYQVTATDMAGNSTTATHSAYLGKQVMGGNAHSGAIRPDGTYTWGRNNYGQTGLGFVSDPSKDLNIDEHPFAPLRMTVEPSFISLAFGQNTSAALADDGTVWTWGNGGDGQLGQGLTGSDTLNEDDSSIPLQVIGITDAVAVTRGYNQTLVLHQDGTVSAFGNNRYGQLGDGTTADRDIAVKPNVSNIVQIASGASFSLAVDRDGRVWSWGQNNSGQLGLGTEDTDAHPTPMEVSIDEPIEAVVAGKGHVLAIARSGAVYGWGLNYSSQIGLYDSDNEDPEWPREVTSPKKLPWFDDAVAVWANGNQSFAERQDGLVYPWGQNMLGTLGLEQDGDVTFPSSSVFGFDQVVDLGNGALHTIGMRQDGSVFSWGWSFQGSLGGGDGTIDRWTYRVPTLVMSSIQP
ncbi:Ig-like domain-containing protein [Oceanobacter antarcticus]|uniref:Ig-like domain-containing protein n=1 Tax=Oceanobacter antarcticus TaxID=3133425 RepID=A0ABW8NFC5_9GAMM